MTKKKRNVKEIKGYRIYSQYILVGAAIGLYYGIFYKGAQSEPDYAMAVILAVLAGLLTTIVRSWKKKKSFGAIALDFLKITAMFLVFLLALQLNSAVYKIGGRALVIVFMTTLGIVLGVLIGVQKKPSQQASQ